MPEDTSVPPALDRLFARCSNIGRWGATAEQGTLNLISPTKRTQAARLVTEGRVIPLGRDLRASDASDGPSPVRHRMLDNAHAPWMSHDTVEIAPHGYAVTHLDATGHVAFDGQIWDGQAADATVTANGLRSGSIRAMKGGIFTRGVLLDVAEVHGRPWLSDDVDVSPADLDRAEALAGVTVGPGDAIFVRIGLRAREAVLGPEDPARRAGLTADCLPWIKDRDIAVYSGDCIERRPSPYPDHALPVHMIGMAAMGLVFLDNPEVEDLREACRDLGRWEFLLSCAPVVVEGATGSAVNPLAIF